MPGMKKIKGGRNAKALFSTLILFSFFSLIFVSCGRSFSGDGGELTGVSAGAWGEPNPHGMVLIKRGSFKMGPQENDTAWGMFQNPKGVSIDAFWMDETEITNAEYRQFVYWVRDSIVRERIFAAGYDEFKVLENKEGELYDKPFLDWKKPIPIEKRADEEQLAAINSVNWKNPITDEVKLDAKQMIYRYEIFDNVGYALRRNRLDPTERILNTDIVPNPNEVIMISKDTAYINDEGQIVRETIERPLSSIYDFLHTYIINIHPDETVWINDFPNSKNDTYMRLYFQHPGYNDYPVVGVTYEQAQAFCVWRTEFLRRSLEAVNKYSIEPYRLPTDGEFEYAARSGKNENKYPWKGDNLLGDKGCFLGNFKPGDGNYTEDGHLVPAQVGSYAPNEFGLYDMAGNVAEWTSSRYLESGPEITSDINPEYAYNAAKEDPYNMKKKVVRGGSWKDVAHFVRSDVRTFEYQNVPRSYIGFRCVRTQVGVGKRK